MWPFKKKEYDAEVMSGKRHYKDKVLEDSDLIQSNLKLLEVIRVYAENNTEVLGLMKEIELLYQYVSPSAEERVLKVDNKIKNKLDDIKIDIVKLEKNSSFEEIVSDIKKIKIMIAER